VIRNLPAVSPIVRLSAGLMMLTISLLLVLDFFGFVPNETAIKLESRSTIAELLAVQVSSEVGRGEFETANETLERLQTRSEDVKSVAIRLSNGRILTSAGAHANFWIPNLKGRSSTKQIEVPIYEGGAFWGTLEIAFAPPVTSIQGFLRSGSINVTLFLMGLFGFLVYWLFLKRALRELDPRSVIPERVNAALNVLAEGLVMLDKNGRIVLANRMFEEMTGLRQQALIGSRLLDMPWVNPKAENDEQLGDLPWVKVLEHGSSTERAQLELHTEANGTFNLAVNTAAISAGDGSLKGVVVTFDDVTELEQQNNSLVRVIGQLQTSQQEIEQKNTELELLATRDPLTGAFNRRSLLEGMDMLISDSQQQQSPLSCVMVDIDHFKSINDRFGHGVGDEVIKLMADILTEVAPPSGLVARYGGEEFVVALPDTSEEQAQDIAEKMRVALASSEYEVEGGHEKTSASFGVSCNLPDAVSTKDLIDRADQALYKAKESGRNRVCMFSSIDLEDPSTSADQELPDQSASDQFTSDSDAVLEGVLNTEHTTDSENGSLITEQEKQDNESPPQGLSAIENDIKRAVMDQLTQGIAKCEGSGQQLAVLSVHVDVLEVVNNSFGIAESDKVIDSIKTQMKALLLSSDTISDVQQSVENISILQVGVAEMLVLINGLQSDTDFTWIVKKLSLTNHVPIEINGSNYSVDLRAGISLFPLDGENAQRLFSTSRSALRDAKLNESRNCCLFFDKRMRVRTREQLLLESELQQAIERDELFLMYQPCINLNTGELDGFETLVRWRNPTFGLVSPVRFIDLAEKIHLINPIGRWIFNSAMRQLSEWRSNGHEAISISVNVSAIQLKKADFLDFILESVTDHNIPPSAVIIEITESILIEDMVSAAAFTSALRAAGFVVALDDFGTGYSSLLYLKDIPIDVVKIDRSFFQDFPNNARDESIIGAIISLSEDLGLTVVAEGVETVDQLSAISQMKCDSVQGYVFSEPLLDEKATNLLADPLERRRMLSPLAKVTVGRSKPKASTSVGFINALTEGDLQSLSEIKVANDR
jgi:diguanylate cyclase (GGDEF)-like protein/PAS domain S-box-containing protein